MRSAMTTRSFHALTVRQRKVMLVNCVLPRTASQLRVNGDGFTSFVRPTVYGTV